MARLPQPGGDNGTWGVILNDYLAVALDADGHLNANTVGSSAIQTSAVTVGKIATSNSPSTNQALAYNGSSMQWANFEPFVAAGTANQYYAGTKSWLTLSKYSVGLGNVDDTADTAKPISTATQTALNSKVQFVTVTTATATGTAAKTATVPGYTPAAGDYIRLVFTPGNSVAAVTLSINGGTAYALRIGNAAVTVVSATTAANGFFFLYFDGTYYHMFGSNRNTDTDTTYTVMTTAEVDAGSATTARSISGTVGAYIRNQGALKAWTDRTVDEDNMVSNSDTKWPTQQSVKAYVDASSTGKANAVHTHSAADITSGVIAAGQLPTASPTSAGVVTMATTAEAVTGTDTTKAVTAAGVKAAITSVSHPIVFVDELGDIPPGTPVDTLVVVRAI